MEHLVGRDVLMELVNGDTPAGDALRLALGQWRAACSLARAGGGVTDYLHEFAHDGRHLLGVPCH
ncbi:MAG: CbtB-domain containing protein [Rubrobacter sp.]|nr:CbtB-domain containing protein [Rubrobacter sp.]